MQVCRNSFNKIPLGIYESKNKRGKNVEHRYQCKYLRHKLTTTLFRNSQNIRSYSPSTCPKTNFCDFQSTRTHYSSKSLPLSNKNRLFYETDDRFSSTFEDNLLLLIAIFLAIHSLILKVSG